ncbi:beta-ketoacyl-ACP synthase III [Streptomyces sp. ODS28]|uniref:beta-ketoacyl-ACP synthase III n=1 Tax=Streptomyces sp. ODS28 TaxID=3136688 RepID=UPI0031EFA89E
MSESTPAAVICGIGACLPPRVVSNEEVVRRGVLETTDAWIRTRTGVAERRRAAAGVSTGDLAAAAGRAALASAGTEHADLLLLATTTPDRRCPATAPEVAYRLGLGHVPAFDLAAVCSGFLYGLATADALLRAGVCSRPLVIGAETYSTIVDPLDRDTAAVFGDGAGATLLRPGRSGEPGAVRAAHLGSDGSGGDLISIAAGGSRRPDTTPRLCREVRYFRMRGREVYRHAVRRMTESSATVLGHAGWSSDSVRAFIGHQANQRILDAVAQRLAIAPQHCFGNIRDVGNTAAASIPLALAGTAARGAVRPGARTLLTAFGGGLTWASVAANWPGAAPHHRPPEPREASADTDRRTADSTSRTTDRSAPRHSTRNRKAPPWNPSATTWPAS